MLEWLDKWESVLRGVAIFIAITVALGVPIYHINENDKRHLEKEAVERGYGRYNSDKEFEWINEEELTDANAEEKRGPH